MLTVFFFNFKKRRITLTVKMHKNMHKIKPFEKHSAQS